MKLADSAGFFLIGRIPFWLISSTFLRDYSFLSIHSTERKLNLDHLKSQKYFIIGRERG